MVQLHRHVDEVACPGRPVHAPPPPHQHSSRGLGVGAAPSSSSQLLGFWPKSVNENCSSSSLNLLRGVRGKVVFQIAKLFVFIFTTLHHRVPSSNCVLGLYFIYLLFHPFSLTKRADNPLRNICQYDCYAYSYTVIFILDHISQPYSIIIIIHLNKISVDILYFECFFPTAAV